jgi:hypothetical protein
MPAVGGWECCHCHHIWSYTLYISCVNCQHRNCSRCSPATNTVHLPYNAKRSRPDPSRRAYGQEFSTYRCCQCWDRPMIRKRRCVSCDHITCSSCELGVAPPIRANAIHSGRQRGRKDFLSSDLGTSNDESLQTSKIAVRTVLNQDDQQANFASSLGSNQVKSATLPIKTTSEVPDATLLHSHESDYVVQNSSTCANEPLSGVKSDSSVIANVTTLVTNDLAPHLELLQVNSRYFCKSFFELV